MVMPDAATSSVETSSSTVAITVRAAEANRSSSTYGCSRCSLQCPVTRWCVQQGNVRA